MTLLSAYDDCELSKTGDSVAFAWDSREDLDLDASSVGGFDFELDFVLGVADGVGFVKKDLSVFCFIFCAAFELLPEGFMAANEQNGALGFVWIVAKLSDVHI